MDDYMFFYENNKDKYTIICLYVREAHFVERDENNNIVSGWPIGYFEYEYPQHKTIDDRLNMARKLEWKIPTYIDNMENTFDNIYGAWPDSLFVFNNGKYIFKAKLEYDGYRFDAFTKQLENIL